ncbi:MAG: esterase, partial [Gammaproteobacteria bacterium]
MSLKNKLIAILAVIITSIPAISFAASMTGTGDVYSYTYNGSRAREYKVYVPQSYSETQAVPMVVALHGCVMDHTDALNAWNWDLIADQNNVIIVFPFVTSFTEMRSENCWGYWFENHVTEN